MHLARAFGDKRLDEINTEDVQRLKAALTERAPKTVNNVLTVLSVALRTAVEWGVIARIPCSIKLLKAPKSEASFHDFEEFERLVEVARSEALALLVVLLGGEAGLRRDHGAGMDRRRPGQAAADCGALRVEGPRHGTQVGTHSTRSISASFFARVHRLT